MACGNEVGTAILGWRSNKAGGVFGLEIADLIPDEQFCNLRVLLIIAFERQGR